jgi:AcrR family transcriptional regulator
LNRSPAAKAQTKTNIAFQLLTEPSDRRQQILAVAATLFAKRGYDRVSVRQIADAAGIMGGSLYHHFSSKEEIFREVHNTALLHAGELIWAAVQGVDDPWERLEAACAAHLELQLDPNSVTLPLMSDLSAMTGEMRVEIIRQRDDFEMIYRRLISVLPLRPEVDKEIYRLSLVSLINTVPVWYRVGRLTPKAIAGQIAEIFRDHTSSHANRLRLEANGVSEHPAKSAKPAKRAKRG